MTDTAADLTGDVPAGPEHWNVKVVSVYRGLVNPLPESVPELDQGPPALQLVALDELQERVDWSPEETEAGEALRDAVGASAGGAYQHKSLPEPPLLPSQYQ